MSLTDLEQRQLEAISQNLSSQDPALACKLSRMSGYSLDARRMVVAGSSVLLFCSAVLLAMGIGMQYQLGVLAGGIAAGAAIVTLTAWLVRTVALRPGRRQHNHRTPTLTGQP